MLHRRTWVLQCNSPVAPDLREWSVLPIKVDFRPVGQFTHPIRQRPAKKSPPYTHDFTPSPGPFGGTNCCQENAYQPQMIDVPFLNARSYSTPVPQPLSNPTIRPFARYSPGIGPLSPRRAEYEGALKPPYHSPGTFSLKGERMKEPQFFDVDFGPILSYSPAMRPGIRRARGNFCTSWQC